MAERMLHVPAVVHIDRHAPPTWWKNWRESHATYDEYGRKSYSQHVDHVLREHHGCRAVNVAHNRLTLLFSNQTDYVSMVLTWS